MLAEDHRALREGLRMLLEVDGDIRVVAESEGGQEVIATALAQRPDVILMDVALLGLDGIEATRQIHAAAPELSIVMLSAHLELHIVRAALDAGALGYLLKRAGGKELREAVRAARRGHPYFSSEVLAAVRERTRAPSPSADPAQAEDASATLTRRETEILQLIASGRSNREIAEILQLSVKTVETHRLHLMEKLDLHDVASLTRYAIRKGLVDLC
jgi:DNA-binding NarL/FixJ family response regulator